MSLTFESPRTIVSPRFRTCSRCGKQFKGASILFNAAGSTRLLEWCKECQNVNLSKKNGGSR
jgi:hypothetical protein